MSLLYDANGDRVELPVITPTNDTTLITWFNSSDDTVEQGLFTHLVTDIRLSFLGDVAGDELEAIRDGGTPGVAVAQAANFAAYALNTWLCLVFRCSTAGTPTLFLGNETLAPAAPSAYVFQQTLVGPVNTAGASVIGNKASGTSWLRGRSGAMGWWDSVLSDADVTAVWRGEARPAGCLGWWVLGQQGTQDVGDHSGNNRNGFAVGLSSADTNPRVTMPGTMWWAA